MGKRKIDTTGWTPFAVYGDAGRYSYVDQNGERHDYEGDDETSAKAEAYSAEMNAHELDARAPGEAVYYRPAHFGPDAAPLLAIVRTWEPLNQFGDRMFTLTLRTADPGATLPTFNDKPASVFPAQPVGATVTAFDRQVQPVAPPKPQGERGKFYSVTEGFTLWDRSPGSRSEFSTRFGLYSPGGRFVGDYLKAVDGEIAAAGLASEYAKGFEDGANDAEGVQLDAQELATVLAALRFYQANGQGEPDNRADDIHDIATDGGNVISMDADGIDALCERLNTE